MFLYSAARRLLHFLLENSTKTDAETKRKFNFGRAKCQNSSFSTCQQRNRTTPRGGRRTCCQQRQQPRRQRQRPRCKRALGPKSSVLELWNWDSSASTSVVRGPFLPKTMTYSAAKHPKPSRYQGPAEQLLLCTALKHTTLMHPSSPVRSSAS